MRGSSEVLWNMGITLHFLCGVCRVSPLELNSFSMTDKAFVYWIVQDSDGSKMVNEYVRKCMIGMGSTGKVVSTSTILECA